jgi:S-adenosylmethionine decarboxylase
VSRTSSAHVDAYVLSESSLFVYADRLVLKTCGTTRLLEAVPELLALAAGLGLAARRCKYSRASFLFPEHQVRPVMPCGAPRPGCGVREVCARAAVHSATCPH